MKHGPLSKLEERNLMTLKKRRCRQVDSLRHFLDLWMIWNKPVDGFQMPST